MALQLPDTLRHATESIHVRLKHTESFFEKIRRQWQAMTLDVTFVQDRIRRR